MKEAAIARFYCCCCACCIVWLAVRDPGRAPRFYPQSLYLLPAEPTRGPPVELFWALIHDAHYALIRRRRQIENRLISPAQSKTTPKMAIVKKVIEANSSCMAHLYRVARITARGSTMTKQYEGTVSDDLPQDRKMASSALTNVSWHSYCEASSQNRDGDLEGPLRPRGGKSQGPYHWVPLIETVFIAVVLKKLPRATMGPLSRLVRA
jgi:hypothetical protein